MAVGVESRAPLRRSFPQRIILCVGGKNNPSPKAVPSNLPFFLIRAKPLRGARERAPEQAAPAVGDTGTSGTGFPALGKCSLAFPARVGGCGQGNCCWQLREGKF